MLIFGMKRSDLWEYVICHTRTSPAGCYKEMGADLILATDTSGKGQHQLQPKLSSPSASTEQRCLSSVWRSLSVLEKTFEGYRHPFCIWVVKLESSHSPAFLLSQRHLGNFLLYLLHQLWSSPCLLAPGAGDLEKHQLFLSRNKSGEVLSERSHVLWAVSFLPSLQNCLHQDLKPLCKSCLCVSRWYFIVFCYWSWIISLHNENTNSALTAVLQLYQDHYNAHTIYAEYLLWYCASYLLYMQCIL